MEVEEELSEACLAEEKQLNITYNVYTARIQNFVAYIVLGCRRCVGVGVAPLRHPHHNHPRRFPACKRMKEMTRCIRWNNRCGGTQATYIHIYRDFFSLSGTYLARAGNCVQEKGQVKSTDGNRPLASFLSRPRPPLVKDNEKGAVSTIQHIHDCVVFSSFSPPPPPPYKTMVEEIGWSPSDGSPSRTGKKIVVGRVSEIASLMAVVARYLLYGMYGHSGQALAENPRLYRLGRYLILRE